MILNKYEELKNIITAKSNNAVAEGRKKCWPKNCYIFECRSENAYQYHCPIIKAWVDLKIIVYSIPFVFLRCILMVCKNVQNYSFSCTMVLQQSWEQIKEHVCKIQEQHDSNR